MNGGLGSWLRKAGNLVVNLRQLGLAEAARLYRYRLSERYHDWRLGIRTTGTFQPSGTGPEEHCQCYEAAHYRCLHTAMEYFAPQGVPDVLLDYGCGLGRAVVVAATYPFARVIGVELCPRLSRQARENVRRAKRRLRCPLVEIVTADAAQYEVPPEVNSVFLFNPFTGPVLQAALDRLYRSWCRRPRTLKLVYLFPAHEPNQVETCRWLVPEKELPTADWHGVRMIAYRSTPGGP